MQTSLTSPNDRTKEYKYKPTLGVPKLSDKQTEQAMSDLVNTNIIKNYPKLERSYMDPSIPNQVYCLHSFIPSKDAVPDKNGFYGMIKFRGAFGSIQEAFERSEKIVRDVDSYHKIYTGYVGRPFPATVSEKYSKEVKKVELKEGIQDIISNDIISKKRKEQKDVQDIKDREERLLERQEQKTDQDPFEVYITNNVKRAQLIWTYKESEKKMKEVTRLIKKVHAEIQETDKTSPEFQTKYKAKYMEARKKSGLKQTDTSFMQFLCKDIDLDFLAPKKE